MIPNRTKWMVARRASCVVSSTRTKITVEQWQVSSFTVAVAGDKFCVVASDTRSTLGYTIMSRKYQKVTKLTSRVVIATAGMRTDTDAFHKVMKTRIKTYIATHGKEPKISAVAQLLSNTLYSRRFFPFYTFNLLAGVDEQGNGKMYGYDAIGSYDEVNCGSFGSGQTMVTPILDSMFKDHNVLEPVAPTDMDDTTNVLRDGFHATAERDIYTGDGLELTFITADGVRTVKEPLRRD